MVTTIHLGGHECGCATCARNCTCLECNNISKEYEEYHEDSNSALTLESIKQSVIDSPIDLYSIEVEYPYYLDIRLNNAEEIYFGYSQVGDDGFTWELTNTGSTVALGAMPNQESAQDVAEKLYQWISKIPQCSDCTAFISYNFSTTFANGAYVASAEINCPNCGVSYETQLDGTEEELLEDLLEFGTSRLLGDNN